MKKLICLFVSALIFTVISTPAMAEKWEYLGKMKQGKYYYDKDSVRIVGPLKMAFVGKEIPLSGNCISRRLNIMIDIARQEITFVRMQEEMKNGDTVMVYDPTTLQIQDDKNSIAYKLQEIMEKELIVILKKCPKEDVQEYLQDCLDRIKEEDPETYAKILEIQV